MPPVQSRSVIEAISELRADNKPTTVEAIAELLDVPANEVAEELRALKRNRLFNECTRNRKRVWLPWREAR